MKRFNSSALAGGIAASAVITAAAFGFATGPAARAPAPSDVAEVLAVIREFDAAWNRKEEAAVAARLHRGYRYFSSRGEVLARERMLAFLRSPDYTVLRAQRSEVEIVVEGRAAIASSRWVGHGSYEGEAFDDDQRCSIVLIRSDSDWRIAAEHCTQIEGRVEQVGNTGGRVQ